MILSQKDTKTSYAEEYTSLEMLTDPKHYLEANVLSDETVIKLVSLLHER